MSNQRYTPEFKDEAARQIVEMAKEAGIILFAEEVLSKTTVKHRYFAASHQIGRVDLEGRLLGTPESPRLQEIVRSATLVVISDYQKTMSSEIAKALKFARQHKIPFIVDPKGASLGAYQGAWLLKPNAQEFDSLFGVSRHDDSVIIEMMRQHSIENLLITLGKNGAKLISLEGGVTLLPSSKSQEVFDVTGAGDVLTAAIACHLITGSTLLEAIQGSLKAAEKSVSKLGANLGLEAGAKILETLNVPELHKLEALRRLADRNSLKVVWANGCFDLIHPGHVHLLQQAKARGDFLVVGLNSDGSVEKLKGNGRPIVSESSRKAVLQEMSSTDWVSIFDGDNPIDNIMALQPDVIVKGDDYQFDEVVGYSEALSWGGKVEIVPRVGGWSSSNVLVRILTGTSNE